MEHKESMFKRMYILFPTPNHQTDTVLERTCKSTCHFVSVTPVGEHSQGLLSDKKTVTLNSEYVVSSMEFNNSFSRKDWVVYLPSAPRSLSNLCLLCFNDKKKNSFIS